MSVGTCVGITSYKELKKSDGRIIKNGGSRLNERLDDDETGGTKSGALGLGWIDAIIPALLALAAFRLIN